MVWNTSFLLGWPIFGGELLVLGSVMWPWKISIFPGKYHQIGGFSIALLIYQSVYLSMKRRIEALLPPSTNNKKKRIKNKDQPGNI